MDPRILHAPAAERNRGPILEVLRRVLPGSGVILEAASGSGQHVAYFAAALPGLDWQPSDPDPRNRASIAARTAGAGNVRAPLALDVLDVWPSLQVDAVIVANLLHVAGSGAISALCTGAAGVLHPDGLLHVYGPFKRRGAFTSAGNARFDAALRAENAAWGIREVESLVAAAAAAGLRLREIVDMPANNLSVVFVKP